MEMAMATVMMMMMMMVVMVAMTVVNDDIDVTRGTGAEIDDLLPGLRLGRPGNAAAHDRSGGRQAWQWACSCMG